MQEIVTYIHTALFNQLQSFQNVSLRNMANSVAAILVIMK